MGDISNPYPPPPPPQSSHSSGSSPTVSEYGMLYYGLGVIATAAVFLFMYNVIILWWSTDRHHGRSSLGPGGLLGMMNGRSAAIARRDSLGSFKYKKEKNNLLSFQGLGGEYECAVCLSVFEEGEEVRLLPRCRHSFHAPCIDMWLYSHFDCPLCRTPIVVLPTPPLPPPLSLHHQDAVVIASHNSRDGLLDHVIPMV